MSKRISLESSFSATDNGLRNVSLITTGIEAAGHGIYLDEKTAETAMKKLIGKSVKSYLRHENAGGDRLGKEIGFFSGIYRQGEQIKATAFEFLESFKKDSKAIADRLIEMAQKVPDQFGVSLVLEYVPVWVMADGTEVQMSTDVAPPGAIRPIPSMRVLDVISADFVGRPAANPNGLLSADTVTTVDASADKQTQTNAAMSEIVTLSMTDHEAKIAELSSAHTVEMAALQEAQVADLAALEAEIDGISKERDALTAALAEKDTAHKAALEKAVADALAPVSAKLAEAEKFDARRLGVPPLQINVLQANLEAAAVTTPEEIKAAYAKLEGKAKSDFRKKHWNVLISS